MPFENGRLYGSFKKICIEPQFLKNEALEIQHNLLEIKNKLENCNFSDSQIVFEIVVLYLEKRVNRHPYLRMGKKLPPKGQQSHFLELVRFYGMPDTVRFALWKWTLNEWDLRLINYNPSSYEMLDSQSKGYRFVTFLWEDALVGNLVEGKRDAFEHLLHDLAHAYMFFREEYDFQGQKKFFQTMLENYDFYMPVVQSNPIFKEKYEYCISDMNSHPAHLNAYLNAICREAGIVIKEDNNSIKV